MQDIIDKYNNEYESLELGKHSYDNEIGTITFIKGKKYVTIYEIYIKTEHRNSGHCRKFIINMILNEKSFMIVSVLSIILYEYLLRFKYNGYRFKLTPLGFLMII